MSNNTPNQSVDQQQAKIDHKKIFEDNKKILDEGKLKTTDNNELDKIIQNLNELKKENLSEEDKKILDKHLSTFAKEKTTRLKAEIEKQTDPKLKEELKGKLVEYQKLVDGVVEQTQGELTKLDKEIKQTETQKEAEKIYKVKKGDSLWKIARENNTTVDALATLNNIENKDFIRIGQELKIPNNTNETSNIAEDTEKLVQVQAQTEAQAQAEAKKPTEKQEFPDDGLYFKLWDVKNNLKMTEGNKNNFEKNNAVKLEFSSLSKAKQNQLKEELQKYGLEPNDIAIYHDKDTLLNDDILITKKDSEISKNIDATNKRREEIKQAVNTTSTQTQES